ncbi:Structural maintenance of chromosomes protein 5 [Tulasnella sp. 418]|nr:Structural maintenance of chromosomes protein 5 [Tulasnella sp. 418]
MARSQPRRSGEDGRASASQIKVKMEGRKEKKTRRRVQDSSEEEEDNDDEGEQDDQDDSDEEEDGETYNGRKRARMSSQGDALRNNDRSRNTLASQPGEGEEDGEPVRVPNAITLPRDVDGYVPGSIVRIKLDGFLTYEGEVEFRPGPYLNMVLGPNGTGKSSIVCAIAIGCAWSPTVLGRADSLKSFVNHNKNTGYVEVELKGKKGEKNLVIRRNINNKNRGSTFTLNGKTCTQKEVTAKVAALNVQASNLCSFLPQDKVSEFASMTPQQLLIQTQKAAGDVHLSQWHEELISLDAQLKNVQKELEVDQDELTRMEQRNKEEEKDVARWRERCELEKEVEQYEIILASQEYREFKGRYDIIKREREVLKQKLSQLQSRNGPMIQLKEEYDAQAKALSREREEQGKLCKEQFKQYQRAIKKCEDLDAEAEEFHRQKEQVDEKEKKRKARIAKLRAEVRELEEKVANPPEVEDIDALNLEMEPLIKENRAMKEEFDQLQARKRNHAEQTARFKADLDKSRAELQDMQNVQKRRFAALAQSDRDCADTITWLRKDETRAMFKGTITEPAYISLELTNPEYADQIENCINWGAMRTFICSEEEDYQLLTKKVIDTPEALGRKGRIFVWHRTYKPETLANPPMNREQLHALGFDGYALDFCRGPEGLMWYLQREQGMHRTAICANTSKVNVERAIQAMSANGSQGSQFIVGHTSYRIMRSAYGRRLAQTSTNGFGPARNLRHEGINTEQKDRLEVTIAELTEKLNQQRQGDDALGQEDEELKQRVNTIDRKLNAIRQRKTKRNTLLEEHERAKLHLRGKKQNLTTQENTPSAESERVEIQTKLARVAERRAECVLECVKLARAILNIQAVVTQLGIRWLQLDANAKALDKLARTCSSVLTKAAEDLQNKQAEFLEIKETCSAKLEVFREKLNGSDPQTQAWFTQLSENNFEGFPSDVESAMQELEHRRARLDTIVVNDPTAIQRYEDRLQKIDQLQNTVARKTQKAKELGKTMKKVEDKWYPALEDLVANVGTKFSAAFAGIGCAGEIQIGKKESYKEWTIEILVKFREDEKLQLLTGQRQSGGERSLTTMMYLMSLTEYARAPFSLVDEINQGMDSRAERVVHNQLVDVTCREESGQYFLITPKLLPNLRYHERMRILCVCNGEWLPYDDNRIGGLKSMIKSYRQKTGFSSST